MQSHVTPHEERIIDELNDLIALDHDALAAYDTAIDKLDEAAAAQQLAEFRKDHARHIVELTNAVRSLGGEPRKTGDIKKVLTKGKVVLAALIGDRQILRAMKSNEDETNETYERAVQACSLAPPAIRDLLDRNLADERRHRAWIEQRLASF